MATIDTRGDEDEADGISLLKRAGRLALAQVAVREGVELACTEARELGVTIEQLGEEVYDRIEPQASMRAEAAPLVQALDAEERLMGEFLFTAAMCDGYAAFLGGVADGEWTVDAPIDEEDIGGTLTDLVLSDIEYKLMQQMGELRRLQRLHKEMGVGAVHLGGNTYAILGGPLDGAEVEDHTDYEMGEVLASDMQATRHEAKQMVKQASQPLADALVNLLRDFVMRHPDDMMQGQAVRAVLKATYEAVRESMGPVAQRVKEALRSAGWEDHVAVPVDAVDEDGELKSDYVALPQIWAPSEESMEPRE